MIENITFTQIIIILGILQGSIFCLLLLLKKENRQANQFLSLLLFSIVFSLVIRIILDFGLYDTYPFLHWLPYSLSFWVGPTFYFYIKSLTNPNFRFGKKHLWHFGLIIFNYLHSIYHLILGRTDPYPKLHNFTEAMGVYSFIVKLIYFYFAFLLIKEYQKLILKQISNTENLTLKWVKEIIIFTFLFNGLGLIYILIDYEILFDFTKEFYERRLFKYDELIYIFNTVILYWISIRGNKQIQTINEFPINGFTEKNKSVVKKEEKDYSDVIKKLISVMNEERLFLNPQLNLKTLENHLDLNSRDISAALNQQLSKNFYFFVNEFRIEEVKKKLVDPTLNHLTILGIAYESGFNSKATFNRIFKQEVGMSPKEYKEKHLEELTNKSH